MHMEMADNQFVGDVTSLNVACWRGKEQHRRLRRGGAVLLQDTTELRPFSRTTLSATEFYIVRRCAEGDRTQSTLLRRIRILYKRATLLVDRAGLYSRSQTSKLESLRVRQWERWDGKVAKYLWAVLKSR